MCRSLPGLQMSKETSQFLPTKINNVIIIMIGETLQFDIVHLGVQQFIQHFDNLCKRGSFIGILWPAIVHYVVEFSAAMLWFLQAVSIPNLEGIVFGINYRLMQRSWLTFRITSAADMPGYGVDPSVTISHISMPKLQISDFTENMLSYSDSVAIHLE